MAEHNDPKPADKNLPKVTPTEATELDLAALSDPSIPKAQPVPDAAPADGTQEMPLDKVAAALGKKRMEGDSTFDLNLPEVTASSSHLFGTEIPQAEAALSDTHLVNLEPIAPVQPASGWFDTQAGDESMPPAVFKDAIDINMDEPGSGILGGSDIFGAPVPQSKPKSDVSDVIAATAYGTAKPAGDQPAKPAAPRGSDVSLNFDNPPGGSTVESQSGILDLPVADEADDSLFGGEEEIDSARIARVPNLPGDINADLGSSPASSMDASSILADLSEPGSLPGDSSAIRLEAPGMDATIQSDADRPRFGRDSTEMDIDLPEADDATDWRSQSDSDLFADAHTRPEFELLPDAGAPDPFGDVNQSSLAPGQSSIFTGNKPPKTGNVASGGSSVPLVNPDGTDSVEFSDHPDLNAADSGSFHVLPAGAVDFDMPDDPHPERTIHAAIPEEDDWTSAKTDPGPDSASGILSRRKKVDATDEMAPVPAVPVKGRPAEPKKGSAAAVKLTADTDEDEPEERKASPRRREPAPDGVSRRGLAGLALGLLLGVGASAGVYFSGAVPNKDGAAVGGTVQVDPNLKSQNDALAADLKAEKDKAAQAEKDMAAAKESIAKLDQDVKAEKDNTLKVEKDLKAMLTKQATDHAKVAGDLKAMNDTLATEVKNEKDKAMKAEKDLLAEKDKVAKVEKDAKEKLADAVKMADTLKETYKKDLATIRTEVSKRDEQIDGLKVDIRKRDDEVARLKDTVTVLVKPLIDAKLLSEKYDAKELAPAVKSVVSRATGPDLTKLIPSELSSIAGTGLTTGHILDLASRTNKSEAASKAAAADISKLKTEHSEEIKSINGLLKKNTQTLKDEHALDLKKAADAAAVASDKLKAEHAAEVKKLADAHTEQVKSLEGNVLKERDRAAEAERRFKSLGGAATLASQELDRQAQQAAARNLDAGIADYKAGRYAAAGKALEDAAKHDPNDAIAWYFLGATHWALGKTDDAKAHYKKGAEREALRLIPARQVEAMLGAIQGPARDALTAARP